MSHRALQVLLAAALTLLPVSASAQETRVVEDKTTPMQDAGLALLIGGGLVSVASGVGAIAIESSLAESMPPGQRSALTVAGIASVALAAATGVAAITGAALMFVEE